MPLEDAFDDLPPQHFSVPEESNDLFMAASGGTSAAKSPSALAQKQQEQQAKAPAPISQRCPTPEIEGSPQGPDMQQPCQPLQHVPGSLPRLLEEQADEERGCVLQMPQQQEQHAPAAAGTEGRGAWRAAHARGQQGKPTTARELLYCQRQGGEPQQPEQAPAKPDDGSLARLALKPRPSTSKAADTQAPCARPKHAADGNARRAQEEAPAGAGVVQDGEAAGMRTRAASNAAAVKAAAKPQSASAPPMQTFAGRATPQKVLLPSPAGRMQPCLVSGMPMGSEIFKFVVPEVRCMGMHCAQEAAQQEAPAPRQQRQAIAEPSPLAGAAPALPNWLQLPVRHTYPLLTLPAPAHIFSGKGHACKLLPPQAHALIPARCFSQRCDKAWKGHGISLQE